MCLYANLEYNFVSLPARLDYFISGFGPTHGPPSPCKPLIGRPMRRPTTVRWDQWFLIISVVKSEVAISKEIDPSSF